LFIEPAPGSDSERFVVLVQAHSNTIDAGAKLLIVKARISRTPSNMIFDPRRFFDVGITERLARRIEQVCHLAGRDYLRKGFQTHTADRRKQTAYEQIDCMETVYDGYVARV
jgi:hypothetical protein